MATTTSRDSLLRTFRVGGQNSELAGLRGLPQTLAATLVHSRKIAKSHRHRERPPPHNRLLARGVVTHEVVAHRLALASSPSTNRAWPPGRCRFGSRHWFAVWPVFKRLKHGRRCLGASGARQSFAKCPVFPQLTQERSSRERGGGACGKPGRPPGAEAARGPGLRVRSPCRPRFWNRLTTANI